MKLSDGDFIDTRDTEDAAIELVDRCNKLIAQEQLSDNLEAYYKLWVTGESRRSHTKYRTWAVLLRKRERVECEP